MPPKAGTINPAAKAGATGNLAAAAAAKAQSGTLSTGNIKAGTAVAAVTTREKQATAAPSILPKQSVAKMDEQSLERNFKALGDQTQNKKAAKKLARNKEAIGELLFSLNSKPKFTKMVEYSVLCLKNMAVDEVSIDEMIEEGVLDTLLRVMSLNPYNEKIQAMINSCVAAFCLNDRLAKVIVDKMTAKGFVFSLKKHKEADTLVSTCRAITKMCRAPANVASFVEAGTIDALSSAIKTNELGANSEDVVAAAAEVLNKIADHKQYSGQLLASGAVEGILVGLKSFSENEILVENAVAAIGKLAKSSKEALEAIKAMGAVDIIVAAIEEHPDSDKILTIGQDALKTLATAQDIGSALNNITTGNNAKTATALAKIASLLLVDENIDYIIKKDGINWLISALKTAVGDESDVSRKIMESGCRALMRMAKDESKIYGIMQKGGVKLLISIMEAHINDESVVVSALAALTKMVTRKENAVFIVKSGGIQAASKCLKAHPESERLAKGALEFFSRIAAHEDTVQMLVEAGIVEAVVGILRAFPTNSTLALYAINTLGRMAISGANLAKIHEAGGLAAVVAVLGATEDAEVAKKALLLLETAALLPENIDALRAMGAMGAMLAAMERFPDNNDIQQICSRVLGTLAGEHQLREAVGNVGTFAVKMTTTPALAATTVDKLEASVRLLSNLALVDGNIAFLHKSGATKAMLEAFAAGAKLPQSEKRDKMLAAAAAGLIRLAKYPEAGQQLVASGALRNILKTAIMNNSNEELAQNAVELASILAADPANIERMIKDGAIEDIIALAKAHPLNEKLMAAATRVLGLLAVSDEAVKKILAAGGAEVVVETIFANMENTPELLNALQVLSQLAVNAECIQALVDAKALDAILEAMRTHPDNPEILSACIQALCGLLINEVIANSVGEKGGLPLCVRAMRDHYKREPLVEMDMSLLDSLSSVSENATRLKEPKLAAVDLVTWIMSAYPGNAVIQETAGKLLKTLTQPVEEEKSEILLADESTLLDGDKCNLLLENLNKKHSESDNAKLQSMLASLAQMLGDPHNAAMMVSKGGLQSLANLVNQNKNNEALFYAASSAFLALAEHGGDQVLGLLEEPALTAALVEMIAPHDSFKAPMNLADLSRAIGAIAKLKLKPATIQEMIKAKPLQSLMKILVESDDPVLLAQAAKLLGKLSNHEEAAQLLAKMANLHELIAAMRRNIKNEEFLKFAVYLLGNLAVSEQMKSQIGIEGGVQLILQVMELYPNNQGLVENCCYALANLSFENQVNNSFIVACKGIQLLIQAMSAHTEAVELLESATAVLCNLCFKNDTNKQLIASAGGAQAIVDTILNNFNSLDLLLTCFRTLGNLAFSKENIEMIIKAGGVQGIVAGMTVHSEELDIIDIAIRVLTNLASDLGEEDMKIMSNEGAVQAIVEVADSRVSNLDIEVAALACLGNLAREQLNAETIIKQDGVPIVVKVMKELAFDPELIENACRLLATLTFVGHSEMDAILSGGATTAVITAMKAHSKNANILISGLNGIANLAHSEDAANNMAKDGPVQLILLLVNEFIRDTNVLFACFSALSGLCRSGKNAVSMAEMAMKGLVNVIQNHAGDSKLLTQGFFFLANLCCDKAASELVMTTGVIPAVLVALRTHRTDFPVIMRGLGALENIAFASKNVKEHMKQEGVIAGVNQIEEANPGKDDIKRACKATIDAINRTDVDLHSTPFMSLALQFEEKKSAREVFGDKKLDKNENVDLPEEIRNFLLAGQLLMKHSNTAPPRARHVYVDAELKYLIWKDPKKPVSADCKMKVYKIKALERGRCTPQLQRKRMGKFLARDECSFAVVGRERTVDLEAKSEVGREKWINALQALVDFKKGLKTLNTSFLSR